MGGTLSIKIPVIWSFFELLMAGGKYPTLSRTISECIDAKRFANLRPIYVLELERYLSAFRTSIGDRPIASVRLKDIEAWLTRPDWSVSTRATGINRLSALFSFAVRRGYIKSNPVDRIERVRLEYKPPQILSPEDADKLLDMTLRFAPTMLGHIVIGLFAGVRPAELDRLTFADVDLERAIVRIDAATSKVRRRRIVELEPKALHWLKAHAVCQGPVTPRQKRRKLRMLAAGMGWECWPKDILRHSAASYLMAKYRDSALVADKLGNSPSILLRHYRELVSAESATAFWNIRP